SRTAMPPPGPVPLAQKPAKAKAKAKGEPAIPAKAKARAELEVAGLPETVERQLLVGVIYAESGTKAFSGEENPDEKLAIGWTFVNRAYYAKFKGPDGNKKCYNDDFGDGTVLSAIKKGSAAYNPVDKNGNKVDNAPWHDVMNGNRMKSLDELVESLKEPGKLEHFKQSVEAAHKIDPYTNKPKGLPKLNNPIPIP